jgi:hypothetical protein
LPEITMSTLYMTLLPEIPFKICGTATILIRILTVWLRFFIGFIIQQWLGVKSITMSSASIDSLTRETKKT